MEEEIQARRKAIHSMSNQWEEWQKAGASKYVVNVLKEGVRVEPSEDLKPFNGKVSLSKWEEDQVKWFHKEIHILKEIGALEPCKDPVIVSKYRLVPKRDSFRLIIDMRPLNKYCTIRKFKYKTLRKFLEFVPRDTEEEIYGSTFDMKSGYHQVKIHPDCRKYFAIQVGEETL